MLTEQPDWGPYYYLQYSVSKQMREQMTSVANGGEKGIHVYKDKL